MSRSRFKLPPMCRTCMTTSQSKYKSIFAPAAALLSRMPILMDSQSANTNTNDSINVQDNQHQLSILDLLCQAAPQLFVQATDELPKTICLQCAEKLQAVHQFQEMCSNSEQQLRLLLGGCDAVETEFTQMEQHEASAPAITPPPPKPVAAAVDISVHDPLQVVAVEMAMGIKLEDGTEDEFIVEPVPFESDYSGFLVEEMHDEHSSEEHLELSSSNVQVDMNKHKSIWYNCDECPRGFANASTLAIHRKVHSKIPPDTDSLLVQIVEGKKKYNCEICSAQLSTMHNLKRHIKFKHTHPIEQKKRRVRRTPGILKPHICKFCNRGFKLSSTLKVHLRTHTGERPFLCSECGKSFSGPANLREHLLRHSGEKRYECPDCPKKFTCLSDLATHKAVHLTIKPHVCDVCNAAFGRPCQLKVHMKHHKGEKPHKCDYCDRRFVLIAHMRCHRRIHTGEKPYKCKYCERSFAQSNDRTKHLRIHLGEKVYRCELCPESFRLAGELREHFTVHKNESEEIRQRNLSALMAAEAKQ